MIFPIDTGLTGTFSGLLGGVLNGETGSSKTAGSVRGAKELVSGWENIAGFAGILGLSARLTGGGSEALFSFRSAGPPRPFISDAPGESRSID